MADSAHCDIVFDSHFHLSGGHDWTGPVKAFKKSGGTAVNLVNLPDYSIPPSAYYAELYERTLNVARSLRKDHGLHVIVSLGPYPLDYFHFKNAGLDPVISMQQGLDLAGKYVKEGMADGFGEVGRPHFNVDQEILDYSNGFIRSAMEIAKDLGVFVMLHTEDLNAESMKGIADMARKAGIGLNRVIKHHSTADVLGTETEVSKTILATRSNTRFIIENKDRAMLESDFVDDPSKPGKVIPADSVPRRAIMIRNEAQNHDEVLADIFQILPYRAFGDDYFKP